jgi:hypothetical protein
VDKLVTAQCVTDDPAPLLQAAGDVLALADVLRPNATAQPFTTEAEQEIWEILGELKACYERDRGQIQTAHNIQASQEADDVGYQEMAHVSIAAGGRQFSLDQLHRPHRVVLARDEQEPGEVGDVGGDPAEGLPLGLHQGQAAPPAADGVRDDCHAGGWPHRQRRAGRVVVDNRDAVAARGDPLDEPPHLGRGRGAT